MGSGYGWCASGRGRARVFASARPYDAFAPVNEIDRAMGKEYLARRAAVLRKQLAAVEQQLSELEAGGEQTP